MLKTDCFCFVCESVDIHLLALSGKMISISLHSSVSVCVCVCVRMCVCTFVRFIG